MVSVALVPVPSLEPDVVLPANVVTTPAEVILRTQLFPPSATYTFPSESSITPRGNLKLALAPVPSANIGDPLPAKVVTTPKGVILRITWLPVSATYTFPDESIATP